MYHVSALLKLLAVISIYTQPAGWSINDQMGNSYSCGGELLGAYLLLDHSVNICADAVDKETVLLHETGHYVYFNNLNDKQREAWINLCGDSKINCEERWADAFKEGILYNTYLCYEGELDCELKKRYMVKIFKLL